MTHAITPAFNLLDEPWIPLRTLAGDIVETGLKDALLKAHDYVAIAETSPPNLIALYRLLLATLHRALTSHHGPWKDSDRARWFREGLPEAPILAYLEQWRERFWLFHSIHPFMQVAALAEADETRDKLKPWTQIVLESANGNTPLVFDHSQDEKPKSASFTQACRSLLGYLQFTPGGLVKTLRDSDKAGALANTAAIMPSGSTLAETLLLGLHPYDFHTSDDLPAWEQEAPAVERLRASPTLANGPNDRYTRLSRAVLVVADKHDEKVRHIRFAAGLALEEDPMSPDPMACYRVSKDSKAVRVSFSESRAVWRDLTSLLPDPTRRTDIPPTVLNWAANLYLAMDRWDAQVQVLSAGLSSDQAKLLRWRAERFILPQCLLTDPDAAAELRAQIRLAEDMFFRLRVLCADLIAQTMPDPTHKDTKSRARTVLANGPAAAGYFFCAERALPKLMQRIAAGDIEAAARDWKTALEIAARNAWEAVLRSLGDSPATMRAEAKTYPRFIGLLKSLNSPTTEPVTKEVES